MKTLTLLLVSGIVALSTAEILRADDNANIKVDVVVNLTDAGHKIVRPDPSHPAYYYPISKGYTEGGQILRGMAKPPEWDVLHAIATSLYGQGYRMATKAHQPELLLMFWWGYKAPAIWDNTGAESQDLKGAGGGNAGGYGAIGAMTNDPPGRGLEYAAEFDGINKLFQTGQMPTATVANGPEMDELVMGGGYDEEDVNHRVPNLRLEQLINAARDPRYYVMISALNFDQALKKNFVVYWTARISTPIYDHTLAEVIPTLLADGASSFGRDTGGPHITESALFPMGRVIVGTPVVKVSSTPAAASRPKGVSEPASP